MSKLPETLEDFSRIAEAFEDPNSNQYTLRVFGYCTECDSVAEYQFSGSLEGTSEACLKCGASQGGPLGSRKRRLILTGDMVPHKVKEEVDRMHSREEQRKFFLELLEKRISDKDTSIEKLVELLKKSRQERDSLLSLSKGLNN